MLIAGRGWAVLAAAGTTTTSIPMSGMLRLLALLQREGRLVDFLMEDIAGATDQQIGMGGRNTKANEGSGGKKQFAHVGCNFSERAMIPWADNVLAHFERTRFGSWFT